MASELRFCYEAGPCGYGIQRQLHSVEARLHRGRSLANSSQTWRADSRPTRRECDQPRHSCIEAGEADAGVPVPDEAHEAIRDLVRARLAAVLDNFGQCPPSNCPASCCAMVIYRPAWTLMHRDGCRPAVRAAVHHIVLEDCIAAVEAATARRRPSGSPHCSGPAGLVARHGGARAAGAATAWTLVVYQQQHWLPKSVTSRRFAEIHDQLMSVSRVLVPSEPFQRRHATTKASIAQRLATVRLVQNRSIGGRLAAYRCPGADHAASS